MGAGRTCGQISFCVHDAWKRACCPQRSGLAPEPVHQLPVAAQGRLQKCHPARRMAWQAAWGEGASAGLRVGSSPFSALPFQPAHLSNGRMKQRLASSSVGAQSQRSRRDLRSLQGGGNRQISWAAWVLVHRWNCTCRRQQASMLRLLLLALRTQPYPKRL